MLFNSLNFIMFFAVVLVLYYAIPKKLQWQFLLAASLAFYMSWKPELIFLLLGVTAINYVGGIAIESTQNKTAKKRRLAICLVLDFGMLAIFKYLMFIIGCFGWLYSLLGREYTVPELNIVLPAGISFYTFMAAGYLIDVYRGDIKSEKDFWHFATFMSFFPQITAGPIERAGHMLPQLFTPKRLKADNLSMGIKLMLWGYFKKLVLADRLSILVNTVFGSPKEFDGLALIIAALCFTVQIYCDFSGYSDIARGVAKTLGIDVINNFERPYFATSIRDFWRRWHISLSTWFRDYLYIPLGGNRVGILRQWFNYMVTFTVSGLWHGAGMSFVVWGALHGVYQIIGNIKYKLFGKKKKLVPILQIPVNLISMLITFLLVAFAWIFFKADNIGDGVYIATHLFSNISAATDKQYLYELFNSLGLGLYELKLTAIALLWLVVSEAVSFKYEINTLLTKIPFVFRFVFYYVTVVIIIAMGVFSSGGDFIYFQF
jgi:D-alanyl-lipoteichoic acid acyltransferase DltB (MBOAT superfamily)